MKAKLNKTLSSTNNEALTEQQLIYLNMKAVLTAARKKEKHRKKHKKHRDREKSSTAKHGTQTESLKSNEDESNDVIEINPTKIDNKENFDQQPEMKKNAFQLMMSSRTVTNLSPSVGKRKRSTKKVTTDMNETVETVDSPSLSPLAVVQSPPNTNSPKNALERLMSKPKENNTDTPNVTTPDLKPLDSVDLDKSTSKPKRGRKKKVTTFSLSLNKTDASPEPVVNKPPAETHKSEPTTLKIESTTPQTETVAAKPQPSESNKSNGCLKNALQLMMQNRVAGKPVSSLKETKSKASSEKAVAVKEVSSDDVAPSKKRLSKKRKRLISSDSESEDCSISIVETVDELEKLQPKNDTPKGSLLSFLGIQNSTKPAIKDDKVPPPKKKKKKCPQPPSSKTKTPATPNVVEEQLLSTPRSAKRKTTTDISTPIEIPATPDTPSSRPKRSCTTQPKSYRFESPSPDKPKQQGRPTRGKQPKEVNDSDQDPVEIIITDEESTPPPSPVKKVAKLAPIFQKAVPKPSIDPEVIKARRAFLESGLPEMMLIDIESQRQFEETFIDGPLFPTISHVTQSDYHLPKIDGNWLKLPLKSDSLDSFNLKPITNLFKTIPSISVDVELSFDKTKDADKFKRVLKSEFETFPTLKTFTKLKDKRKNSEGVLFTEKYRPSHSDHYSLGTTPLGSLKKFLSAWKEEKRYIEDSDDDFDDTASSSSRIPSSNVIVLVGPPGSGKTSAVMALANELNYNVLEINAGQRRTGKKILQELHEATQSHGVRKRKLSEESSQEQVDSKNKKKTSTKPAAVTNNGSQTNHHKMSLILIEDADVVFDEDEGFLNAIKQLSETSKRPLVLTAIDSDLPHLKRFNKIKFNPPNPLRTAKYLTLLSLAEDYQVDPKSIQSLVESNGGDFRKSLLELQFYLLSGGDVMRPLNDPQELNSNETKLNERFKDCGNVHLGLFNFFNRNENQKPNELNEKSIIPLADLVANLNALSTAGYLTRSLPQDNLVSDLRSEISEELMRLSGNEQSVHELRELKNEKKREKLFISSGQTNVLPRTANMEYEAILRQICRSEDQRLKSERKCRNFHYLRNFNTASFGAEYFEPFCTILQDYFSK